MIGLSHPAYSSAMQRCKDNSFAAVLPHILQQFLYANTGMRGRKTLGNLMFGRPGSRNNGVAQQARNQFLSARTGPACIFSPDGEQIPGMYVIFINSK